jgi:uncharacterized protein YlxW (UPF0749 family)
MDFHKSFCKLLRFFNLVDRSCNLSITNIAVIVIITKMALAPFDWATAAGLMVALLNYAHKRSESNKASKAEVKTIELVSMQEKVESLAGQVEQFKAVQDAVAKQSEDTKKLLSNSNLANAFKPRIRE